MPRTEDDDDDKQTEPEDDSREDEFDPRDLKPVRPKIGEDSDNLKQREDWFQKRSGRK